jgi:hypothetical protein
VLDTDNSDDEVFFSEATVSAKQISVVLESDPVWKKLQSARFECDR